MEILRCILLFVELLAGIVALYYFFQLKNTYWKWFSIYLIFIAIQEVVSYSIISKNINNYYVYFGIPLQFLFLFWLYAYKSLNNKILYATSSIIYLATYFPIELYFKEKYVLNKINMTIGTSILIILVIMEFLKQIKNDDILLFKENKMFYINTGVILFYIGTYPFWGFFDIILRQENKTILTFYSFYFILSNIIMYLLFTASFIWGKHRL